MSLGYFERKYGHRFSLNSVQAYLVDGRLFLSATGDPAFELTISLDVGSASSIHALDGLNYDLNSTNTNLLAGEAAAGDEVRDPQSGWIMISVTGDIVEFTIEIRCTQGMCSDVAIWGRIRLPVGDIQAGT